MKTTNFITNKKGNAIVQSLVAIAFVSTIFYFASNSLISNKKSLLKSSDIIYSRLLLHSVTDYLSTGVRQEWCVNNLFVHDTLCDSDYNLKYSKANTTSLGRLVLNESYAGWISKMVVSGLFDATKVATAVYPPDTTPANYFKGIILPYSEKIIDITNIGPAHPLREIIDSADRAEFIKKIKFRFERDNSASLPRYGKEIYLKMIVQLLDKDDEVITISSSGAVSNVSGCAYKTTDIAKCGAYVFSTESLFSAYPRELNSFSLIAPNDLYLTEGLKPPPAGDLEFPMLPKRSLAATYKGINFESPVFVNDNIYVPLPASPGMTDDDKPFTAVKFLDRVVLGNGKVYSQNNSTSVEYSPSVTSDKYSGYWVDEPTFGGFTQGVYTDGETDNGLKVLSGRKVAKISPAKMNLCVRRNLSLIDLQTSNGSELIANISKYADFPKYREQDIILSFSTPNPPVTAPAALKATYGMNNRFKVQEGFSGGALLAFNSGIDNYADTVPAHKVTTTSTSTEITLESPDVSTVDAWQDTDGSTVKVTNSTKAYAPVDLNKDGVNEFSLGLSALHMPIGNVTISWDGGKSSYKTFIPLNGEVILERRLSMSKYNWWLLFSMNNIIDSVTDDLNAFKSKSTNWRIKYTLNHSSDNKLDDTIAVTGNPTFSLYNAFNSIPDLTDKNNFKNWIVFDSKWAPEKSLFDRQFSMINEGLTKIEANVQAGFKFHNDDLIKLQADKTKNLADTATETANLAASAAKIAGLNSTIKKLRDDYSYINKWTVTATEIKNRNDDIAADELKIKALEVKIKNAQDDIAAEKLKTPPNAALIAGWNTDITNWTNDKTDLENEIIKLNNEIKNLTDYQVALDDLVAENATYTAINNKITVLNTALAKLNTDISNRQEYVDDYQYQLCILNSCPNTNFPSKGVWLSFDDKDSIKHATVGRAKVVYDKGILAGSNANSMSTPAIVKLISEPYMDNKDNKIPLENFLVFHKIRVLTSNMDKFRENDGSKTNYYHPQVTFEGYDLGSSREDDHPSVGSLVAKKHYDRKNILQLKSTNFGGNFEFSTFFTDQKILINNKYPGHQSVSSPTQVANLPSATSPDPDPDPAPYSLEASWYQFEADCVKVSNNKGLVADDPTSSFKPLTWNQSLTDSTKVSWDFATQGAYWGTANANNPATLYNSSEPMASAKRDFIFPDEPTFLVRSILHDCTVPNTVELITGFYTCQNFIVLPRTKPLRIIGTMIITNKMKIDISAVENGVYWSNIYHPTAINILQNLARPVLKPEYGAALKCSDVAASAPIWHPAPALDDIANFYKCSPLSLKAKADPFAWTTVDPDCGLLDDKSNSVTCKNQVRRFNVVELYRRSSL